MSLGLFIPLGAVTGFWALVALAGLLCVPKGPNRELWRVSIFLTSVCCYLFWLIVFIPQWHPFYGPLITSKNLRVITNEWKPKW